MAISYRLPAALLWPGLALLYLVVPGHPLGLLRGVPLGGLAAGVGLLVGLAAWCGRRPTGGVATRIGVGLLGAAGLKLALASAALPYGLAASYAAGADGGRGVERSTEWRLEGATRVERGLELVGDGFPLHFFNDLRRFNFYTPSQPRRDLLPFAVTWRGWLVPGGDSAGCLRLRANGTAALRVGAAPPVGIERAERVESREVCGGLAGGAAPLELHFARPDGGVPFLMLQAVAADGRGVSIGSERFLRADAGAEAIGRDRWLGRLAWALDVGALGVMLGVVLGAPAARRSPAVARPDAGDGRDARAPSKGGRLRGRLGSLPRLKLERPLLALSVLAAFVEGVARQRHFAGRTAILSGGDDWLAYESYARDTLLNGLLITGGKPLGQGETFYYQPLYIYFLAGLHALFGESVHGVLVAQYVAVAVAGVLGYFLARELFGRTAAAVAFGLFFVFRYAIFNQVAEVLLSENLVTLLIPAMLFLLARWQRSWRRADLVGGGLLLGLAILTRSTPLLFLPPAAGLVALAQRRKFGQWRPALGAAGLFVGVALALASLVGARNLVVAGRPALLPESASANLWEAHRPSAKVDLTNVNRDPLYRRLGLDRQTREVLEFVRQDPLGYAATLAPMGLYALGITGPALGTGQVQYELVALAALYLGGLLFVPGVRRGPVWMLHAFVLTHLLQMMVFFSHQYGFRLPLPMYGPMIVVAGATLAALWGRAAGQDDRRRNWSLATAVVLAGAWTTWQVVQPRAVEARVFGLGGDAGTAARAVLDRPESWQADRIYFSGQDGRTRGVAYLPGLAYREMKWIDTTRALVWPPDGRRGVLVRPAGAEAPLIAECWGTEVREVGLGPGVATDRLVQWLPGSAERRCATGERTRASFGGVVSLLEASAAGGAEPTGPRVAWRVVQRPSARVRPVVELLDAQGGVLATELSEPYPSVSWEAGELIVARLPLPDEAMPGARPGVGFGRGNQAERLAIDDPLALYGQLRVMTDE